jgi:hypothetical protein
MNLDDYRVAGRRLIMPNVYIYHVKEEGKFSGGSQRILGNNI